MSKLVQARLLFHLNCLTRRNRKLIKMSTTGPKLILCQYNTYCLRKRLKEEQVHFLQSRLYTSSNNDTDSSEELTSNHYEEVAEETLQSLSEKFDMIADSEMCGPEFDATYESGVLTVHLNDSWGTYVINKQSPNKQIWLSSPVSGPKRYDFIDGKWIYKHDGVSLHKLLTDEISKALNDQIDFSDCEYSNT